MAEISEPFDGGPYMTETGWSTLWSAALSNGVLDRVSNGLRVYSDNDGRQIKVSPGRAHINGHLYESTDIVIKPIAAYTGSGNRSDLVVLRLDSVNKKMTIEVVPGSPALALADQRYGVVYEIVLGNVTAPAGSGSISATNAVSTRTWATGQWSEWKSWTISPVTMPDGGGGHLSAPYSLTFNANLVAEYRTRGNEVELAFSCLIAVNGSPQRGTGIGFTVPFAPDGNHPSLFLADFMNDLARAQITSSELVVYPYGAYRGPNPGQWPMDNTQRACFLKGVYRRAAI